MRRSLLASWRPAPTLAWDQATTWATREAQYDAVCTWGIPDHALLQRLSCLQMPVFAADVEAFLADAS